MAARPTRSRCRRKAAALSCAAASECHIVTNSYRELRSVRSIRYSAICMETPMAAPLVDVRSLTKYFDAPSGTMGARVSRLFGTQVEEGAPVATTQDHRTLAVDDFNLTIEPGEVVGLVGESGSGKSTVARCLLRLIDPSAGEIRFEGQSIVNLRGGELRRFRQKAQMVFQDPTASLDPHF